MIKAQKKMRILLEPLVGEGVEFKLYCYRRRYRLPRAIFGSNVNIGRPIPMAAGDGKASWRKIKRFQLMMWSQSCICQENEIRDYDNLFTEDKMENYVKLKYIKI